MSSLLTIKNLSVRFTKDGITTNAVDNISFDVPENSFTALVGESGSGKSVTALSILRLLPPSASISGSIHFPPANGNHSDLTKLTTEKLSKIRGNNISMIFQEPMTSLNPVMTCGRQVMETLVQHKAASGKNAREKTIALFEKVQLPSPAAMFKRYPHQLSGGQKQRVMIAMAIACNPSLLIADEPTTALDVKVQKNILSLLQDLREENNMSLLLITHDLALVSDVADYVVVMHKGKIVEQGSAADVLKNPSHNYTRGLLECRPRPSSKGKKLPVLSEQAQDFELRTSDVEPGTSDFGLRTSDFEPVTSDFELRTSDVEPRTSDLEPRTSLSPVIEVKDLWVQYDGPKRIFRKPAQTINAVAGVSFSIFQNETVGLVGESGCGKTTIGKVILRLIKPSSGQVLLHGKDMSSFSGKESFSSRREIQVVFQDPYGSLNPRITISDAITEAMQVHGLYKNNRSRRDKTVQLLEQVGMGSAHLNRYPHEFSGGQRQRICIARALSVEPQFLVFDESVSALDVSVQAQVLNLINKLKAEHHFTSLFISHDLSVIHYISDRVLVMKDGKIVEEGKPDDVLFNPQNEYTRSLVEAIPGKLLNPQGKPELPDLDL